MFENTPEAKDDFLKGVRVLDLSLYIPGPYATLHMVKMGADIIKVEPPGGDPMRFFGSEAPNISPVYLHLNQGKKITELDLKNSDGQAKLKQLIESANVLLEGFRPGILERLGFGYEELISINPRLIVCRISGFGQSGPRAQDAGHDLGYGAYAGLYTRPASTEKPQIITPPVADHAGALNALVMISAALYRQTKSGVPCELDISLSQAVADWQYISELLPLQQIISGDAAYYNFYQTKDQQFISLAAIEPKFWRAFCEVVGQSDWVVRQSEKLPQRQLMADVAKVIATQTLAEWQEILRGVDCCFEPVIDFNALQEKVCYKAENNHTIAGQSSVQLQLMDANKLHWNTR